MPPVNHGTARNSRHPREILLSRLSGHTTSVCHQTRHRLAPSPAKIREVDAVATMDYRAPIGCSCEDLMSAGAAAGADVLAKGPAPSRMTHFHVHPPIMHPQTYHQLRRGAGKAPTPRCALVVHRMWRSYVACIHIMWWSKDCKECLFMMKMVNANHCC